MKTLSEQKYHALMNNASDAILIADEARNIIEVNKKAEELFGYTQEEFMRQRVEKLHPKEELNRVFASFEEMLKKGYAKISDVMILRKDNTTLPVDLTCSMIEQDGKKLAQAIMRDISGRKKAEEAIKKSEEQYRLIVETATEGIWTIDGHDRISFANGRVSELLGYSIDELMGKEIFDFMDDEWKEMARSDISSLRRGGHERHDFKFCRKDGSDLWVIISAAPLFDSHGRYAGALEMLTSISERKRAEEVSRATENRYRKLMETANDAIILAEADTGIIVDANKKAEEMLGLPLERIIGKHQSDLHPKDKAKLYRKIFEQHVKASSAFMSDMLVSRSDGTVMPVELRASVVRVGNKKVIQGIFRDLTERRAAEAKVQESEERLRAMLNNSTALIYGRGTNGQYIFVNRTFEKLSHLKEKRVLGNTPYDIFTKEIADMFQSTDVKVLETGEPLEVEETLPLSDGIHTYATLKFPLKNSDGRVYAMCAMATDITQREAMDRELKKYKTELEAMLKERTAELVTESSGRKSAESETQELKKQLEFILGATHTGLDIIDAEYNIRYIDPAWKKLYGDPAGKKCYEYFMGKKGPCPCCGAMKALSTKKRVVTEEVLVKEDNRPIQVTTIPFKNEAGEWLVAEINVDISERKKMEEELRKKNEQLMAMLDKNGTGDGKTGKKRKK